MSIGRHLEALVVTGVLFTASALAQNPQSGPPPSTAPCAVAPQPVPCGSAPSTKPKSADPFAFPEDPATTGAPIVGPAPSANLPDPARAPVTTPAAPDTQKDTPILNGTAGKGASGLDFPDEVPPPAPLIKSGSSSSSSSSSGSDSVSDPDANPSPDPQDKTSTATPGRHLLHRVNPIGTKLQNADEREAEDLDIAHFYMQSGDLKGAYLRSQDAVKTAPEDPDAHFALGEAARKLNKRDEAIAEYTACLKFDPEEKQAKAAQKELARLKQ